MNVDATDKDSIQGESSSQGRVEAGGEEPSEDSRSVGGLISVSEPKNFIERLPAVGFVWHLYRAYSRRNGPLLSAGIAYYALFSMGPLLLVTLEVTGRLFGPGQPPADERVANVLQQYMGQEMAAMLASVVTQLNRSQSASYTFAIVGIGILLYGASRLFVRLQSSFNIMWDVRIVSREFSTRRLLSRLLVFGLILIPTLLLIVALVLGTAISWLEDLTGRSGLLVSIAESVIPFIISWLALWTIYVVLPDIRLAWRECWFTALLVAIGWTVATRVFSMYLGWSGGQKYAGAVGALIGVIFWVDILAIGTLLGVRFNKAIYLWRKKVIQPYYYAALVTELPDVESVQEAPPPPDDADNTGTSPAANGD